MEILFPIILFVVPFAIARGTGRSGLAVFVTTGIYFFIFTILNMKGGHLNEALTFAFGTSMFVALFSTLGAYFGARFHSSSNEQKSKPKLVKPNV